MTKFVPSNFLGRCRNLEITITIHAYIYICNSGKARSTLQILKTVRFRYRMDNAIVSLDTFKTLSTVNINSETAFRH